MAWERGYYYRVRKVGGRVFRQYVGRGPVAEVVAQMDALEREQREAERAAWRAARAELDALDSPLNDLNDLADLVARPPWWPPASGSTSAANGGSDVANVTKPVEEVPTDHFPRREDRFLPPEKSLTAGAGWWQMPTSTSRLAAHVRVCPGPIRPGRAGPGRGSPAGAAPP
jgi:hypothetical protein